MPQRRYSVRYDRRYQLINCETFSKVLFCSRPRFRLLFYHRQPFCNNINSVTNGRRVRPSANENRFGEHTHGEQTFTAISCAMIRILFGETPRTYYPDFVSIFPDFNGKHHRLSEGFTPQQSYWGEEPPQQDARLGRLRTDCSFPAPTTLYACLRSRNNVWQKQTLLYNQLGSSRETTITRYYTKTTLTCIKSILSSAPQTRYYYYYRK